MYKGLQAHKPMSGAARNLPLEEVYSSLSESKIVDFLVENAKLEPVKGRNESRGINTYKLSFGRNDFNPEIGALLYEKGKDIFKDLKRANYSDHKESFEMEREFSNKGVGTDKIRYEAKIKAFMINRIVASISTFAANDPVFIQTQKDKKMLFGSDEERRKDIGTKIVNKIKLIAQKDKTKTLDESKDSNSGPSIN